MNEQPQDREGGGRREPRHEQHNERPVPRIYVASLSDYGCKSSGWRELFPFRDKLAIGRLGVNGDLLFSDTLLI
jgi:hypothetical protein